MEAAWYLYWNWPAVCRDHCSKINYSLEFQNLFEENAAPGFRYMLVNVLLDTGTTFAEMVVRRQCPPYPLGPHFLFMSVRGFCCIVSLVSVV